MMKTIANYKDGLRGSGTFYSGNIKDTDTPILKEGKIPEDWWEFAIAARFPVDGIKEQDTQLKTNSAFRTHHQSQ